MKKRNYKILWMSFLSLFLFLCPYLVNAAGTATTSFSGNSSVYINKNIEITLYVGSVSGTTNNSGLAAFGGTLTYDTSKLELISTSSLAPFTIEFYNNTLGGFGASTIKGRQNIMKFTFKAKDVGKATISYSGSSQPDSTNSPVKVSGCSKTITIKEPPSTNNNLASLSVSEGSINFSKNTTSYKVNVENNVTSISISATSEDSKAKVSGTGVKPLKYGDNTFNVVVTAEDGSKKTYTITVNRKDIRNSDNSLSKLTVKEGTISPSFAKDTLNYTMSVPYEISSLTINATASNSKAKVSISGANNLIAEETSTVTIKVTAENETVRTYTIKVTRGKDPNKKLSNNNNLTSLVPETGTLEPVFAKDVVNYTLTVPYTTKEITFATKVEDVKYATVKQEGNKTLNVGNNAFRFIVTAEDGSTKTYHVTVTREKDPNYVSTSTYLKEIKLENGSIVEEFNKEKYVYTYTKTGDIKVEATPEDEASRVTILRQGDIITIFVEAGSGDANVYILTPKEESQVFIYVLVAIILTVVGLIIGYLLGKKKKS